MPSPALPSVLRVQLRLQARSRATWGWWLGGVVLTGLGEALDVLGHLDGTHDPGATAASAAALASLGLGAWVGGGVPADRSLLEEAEPWAALPHGTDLPRAARVGAAVVLGSLTGPICLAFAFVLYRHVDPLLLLRVGLGGGLVAGVAAAWAALLRPGVGAPLATLAATGLGVWATVGAPRSLLAILPPAWSRSPPTTAAAVAAVATMGGLLLLAPPRRG